MPRPASSPPKGRLRQATPVSLTPRESTAPAAGADEKAVGLDDFDVGAYKTQQREQLLGRPVDLPDSELAAVVQAPVLPLHAVTLDVLVGRTRVFRLLRVHQHDPPTRAYDSRRLSNELLGARDRHVTQPEPEHAGVHRGGGGGQPVGVGPATAERDVIHVTPAGLMKHFGRVVGGDDLIAAG